MLLKSVLENKVVQAKMMPIINHLQFQRDKLKCENDDLDENN